MGYPPLGLGPDLGAGRLVVGLRIHLVVELVGEDRSRSLPHQLPGLVDIVVWMIGRHRRWSNHHLGAVGLEQPHLFLRHLVRHREDAAVALERRRHGQADTGVAAGPFHNHPTRLELPSAFRVLDDLEADPVLH